MGENLAEHASLLSVNQPIVSDLRKYLHIKT